MSSELTVVTAEIVDILPRQHQTLANKEWVETSLQEGSVADVLAACKEYFNVANGKLATCEKRLDAQGIKLDRHIEYVDKKFKEVDREISTLRQDLAVVTAVNNERATTQQFLTGQIMHSVSATNQSIVTVASNSSKTTEHSPVVLAFCLAFGVILISCMAALVIKPVSKEAIEPKPTQTIEYKQVPRKQWEQL